MGRKKLSIEEMTRALTLKEQGVPMNKIAVELNVSIEGHCVYLKKTAAALPAGTTPPRKQGSERTRKTSVKTDKWLVR